MKSTEMKLKSNITLNNKINIIDFVCNQIIGTNNTTGVTYYNPYYKEYAFLMATALYLIDGIEFEPDDDILEIATTNEDVRALIQMFTENYVEEINYIDSMISDIIDFRKQELLNRSSILDKKISEILDLQKSLEEFKREIAENENKLIKQQIRQNDYTEEVLKTMTPEETAEMNRRLLDGKFDMDKIAELVTEKYLNSEIHKGKEKDIIDTQTAKIIELASYKKAHDARNILSGK